MALAWLAGCGGGGGASAGNPVGMGVGPVTSAVTGTVRDKSGRPITGAQVSAFHTNDHTTLQTTTAADGTYAVSGVTTGNNSDYQIYVTQRGFGFLPSVTDVAGSVDKADFNGLYRMVAEFFTMPARPAVADFTALRPGDREANLPRTGQTMSYAGGDDGAQGLGVAWPVTRFTDNGDGTVTDGLSGLIWLRDAGCTAASDWASGLVAAQRLASGACGLTDGSAAGLWRMPNANELESLVDVSQAAPALTAGHPFTHVDLAHAYWSSTTYMAATGSAMAIRFSDGRWINGADAGDGSFSNVKTTSRNSLWAVRSGARGTVQLLATGVFAGPGGGSFGVGDDANLRNGVPLTSPRFIDNGDGTLADTVTGLTWLKQADCIHATWAGALTSVDALSGGQCGLSDGSTSGQWHLPNRNEMLSLSDRAPTFPQAAYLNGAYQASGAVTGPVVFGRFVVSDYYWTSTTDATDPLQAWTLYSCDFGVYNLAKTELHYALAVR